MKPKHPISESGTKSNPQLRDTDSQFNTDVANLLNQVIEFRSWIDQRKKINVAFMKAYKKRLEEEIGPSVKKFAETHGDEVKEQSRTFQLIVESIACLKRPVKFMETRLRPSVGMGVFLERWMLNQAVAEYLQACCADADRYLDPLIKKYGSL